MADPVWDTPDIGREIGITTTGRRSTSLHRREVNFYNLDRRLYITGKPGRRDWYANLLGNPNFTVHLKDGKQGNFSARATPIRDPAQRRQVLTVIHQRRKGSLGTLDDMVDRSPLIEFQVAIVT